MAHRAGQAPPLPPKETTESLYDVPRQPGQATASKILVQKGRGTRQEIYSSMDVVHVPDTDVYGTHPTSAPRPRAQPNPTSEPLTEFYGTAANPLHLNQKTCGGALGNYGAVHKGVGGSATLELYGPAHGQGQGQDLTGLEEYGPVAHGTGQDDGIYGVAIDGDAPPARQPVSNTGPPPDYTKFKEPASSSTAKPTSRSGPAVYEQMDLPFAQQQPSSPRLPPRAKVTQTSTAPAPEKSVYEQMDFPFAKQQKGDTAPPRPERKLKAGAGTERIPAIQPEDIYGHQEVQGRSYPENDAEPLYAHHEVTGLSYKDEDSEDLKNASIP